MMIREILSAPYDLNGQRGKYVYLQKKFRIRETKNLATDADSRTDTILERLHDLSKNNIYISKKYKEEEKN